MAWPQDTSSLDIRLGNSGRSFLKLAEPEKRCGRANLGIKDDLLVEPKPNIYFFSNLTLKRPLRRKLRISADSSLIRQKNKYLFYIK